MKSFTLKGVGLRCLCSHYILWYNIELLYRLQKLFPHNIHLHTRTIELINCIEAQRVFDPSLCNYMMILKVSIGKIILLDIRDNELEIGDGNYILALQNQCIVEL